MKLRKQKNKYLLPLHQELGQTGVDRGQSLAQKPWSAQPQAGLAKR